MMTNLDPQITNELRESSGKSNKLRTFLVTGCEILTFIAIILLFYLAFYGTYAIESEWDRLIGGIK